VLHVARLKYRKQKIAKNSTSWHHDTSFSGCIFASKARIDNRKKKLNSHTSSTCPHNMVNFAPLTAEIVSGVWSTPANFNRFRVLASLLQSRRSLPETNQALHDRWPTLLFWYIIYIFGGSCPLTEFCHVPNSLYVQVLRYPILAALLPGTPAAGISQTLRRGARNGITELSHADGVAPPIFGWAAITLVVSPHSS